MSLLRTGINPLITINTIVFDDFVKLNTNFQIPLNEYVYTQYNKDKYCLDNLYIIRIEDLKKLQLNDNIKSEIKLYEEIYLLHKNVLSDCSDKLKSELYKYVFFENSFEFWNITNLVRKYNIDGRELFLTMVEDTKKYQDIWNNKEIDGGYKYFDYCGNYGLKNMFPLNIYQNQTILNLRRYVDRSGINGYYELIKLFEKKIQLPPNTNFEIEENIVNDNKTDEKIYINNDNIQIPSMNLERLEINYNNRNNNSFSDKSPAYPLDINYDGKFDEFNKFLSEGKCNKVFNLDKYFKYVLRKKYDYSENKNIDKSDLENYILTPLADVRLENISIVNCIIFGESNIRYSDVEKLLSLIRFESEYYSCILDNFIIYNYSEHHLSICSDDSEINSLEFCKYQNMLECAKWLVQIMNQINPSQINHHNYHTIVNYCKLKDNIEEQNFNNLTMMEKVRIKVKSFENN